MLAFVSASDFVTKPYQLPGLSDPDLGTTSFSDFVTNMQRSILLELLGETLYQAFDAGIAAVASEWSTATVYATGDKASYGTHQYQSLVDNNQNIVPGTDPLSWQDLGYSRWLALANGDFYTLPTNNRKYHYEGLNQMLVPFTYVVWLIDQDVNVVTTGGSVKTNTENSANASSDIKIRQAYADFAEMCGGQHDCIGNQGTLFGFLYSNAVAFYADVASEGDSDFIGYLQNHFPCSAGNMNEFDL